MPSIKVISKPFVLFSVLLLRQQNISYPYSPKRGRGTSFFNTLEHLFINIDLAIKVNLFLKTKSIFRNLLILILSSFFIDLDGLRLSYDD